MAAMAVSYLPTLIIDAAPGQLAQTKPSRKLKITSLSGSRQSSERLMSSSHRAAFFSSTFPHDFH